MSTRLDDYLKECVRRGYDTPPVKLFDDALLEAYDNAVTDYHRYSSRSSGELDLEIMTVAAQRATRLKAEIRRRMR